MAKKKAIQKAIRIGGKRVSQRFSSKEAAEFWYNQMFNKKHFQSDGIVTPHGKRVQFKDYILNEWLVDRKKNYPASTWMSDEQRLVDHVIPVIGNMQLNKITSVHIRTLLIDLVSVKNLAPATRNRVRAVISSVFNDALNRDEPLVAINPTFGLKFSSKRTGNKAPSNLHTSKDCITFLNKAKELGETHFVVCALGLMSGLRKQEMIALRWDAIDYSGRVIEVSQKYIQASKKIVQGTKKGENTARYVPVSKELLGLLKNYQKKSDHKTDIDFVLTKKDGSHFEPKAINNMINEVCLKAGLKVTVHGLRHTFGREFAANSGNMRALQEILGHSNMSTTELYSKLGKDRLTGFREIVSFDLDNDEE
jgi:integrase